MVCSGCGKPIEQHYHQIQLHFDTIVIDSNTKIPEKIPSMARNTIGEYCDACFESLVKHLSNFIQEVGPHVSKHS